MMKLYHFRRHPNRSTMPGQGLADHCAGSDNSSEDIKFYSGVLLATKIFDAYFLRIIYCFDCDL